MGVFRNRTRSEYPAVFYGYADVTFKSWNENDFDFQMNEIGLTSVVIPAMAGVFWKGGLGKTCLSKMQSNQLETLSLNSTKVCVTYGP